MTDDLISRSVLRKRIVKDYRKEFFGSVLWNILDDMPTIDAAPVVHGRWIERKSIHADSGVVAKCSICKKDIQYLGQRLKYCPNCGAKMDAEESTND